MAAYLKYQNGNMEVLSSAAVAESNSGKILDQFARVIGSNTSLNSLLKKFNNPLFMDSFVMKSMVSAYFWIQYLFF